MAVYKEIRSVGKYHIDGVGDFYLIDRTKYSVTFGDRVYYKGRRYIVSGVHTAIGSSADVFGITLEIQ